jgi:polyhydroxyalkanoate synthesis repressor PhaR
MLQVPSIATGFTEGDVPLSKPRIIVKYANRRLYDPSASRYVTLADIRELVLAGIEFLVTDRRNQKDITREVLLQVMTEQEKGMCPLLSHAFLCSLIRKQVSAEQAQAGGVNAQAPEFDAHSATNSVAADTLAA